MADNPFSNALGFQILDAKGNVLNSGTFPTVPSVPGFNGKSSATDLGWLNTAVEKYTNAGGSIDPSLTQAASAVTGASNDRMEVRPNSYTSSGNYLSRAVVIVLGLIAISTGLSMFGRVSPVTLAKTAARV